MPGGKRTHSYKTVHCTHTSYVTQHRIGGEKVQTWRLLRPVLQPRKRPGKVSVETFFSQHAHALSHGPVLTLISSQL